MQELESCLRLALNERTRPKSILKHETSRTSMSENLSSLSPDKTLSQDLTSRAAVLEFKILLLVTYVLDLFGLVSVQLQKFVPKYVQLKPNLPKYRVV